MNERDVLRTDIVIIINKGYELSRSSPDQVIAFEANAVFAIVEVGKNLNPLFQPVLCDLTIEVPAQPLVCYFPLCECWNENADVHAVFLHELTVPYGLFPKRLGCLQVGARGTDHPDRFAAQEITGAVPSLIYKKLTADTRLVLCFVEDFDQPYGGATPAKVFADAR